MLFGCDNKIGMAKTKSFDRKKKDWLSNSPTSSIGERRFTFRDICVHNRVRVCMIVHLHWFMHVCLCATTYLDQSMFRAGRWLMGSPLPQARYPDHFSWLKTLNEHKMPPWLVLPVLPQQCFSLSEDTSTPNLCISATALCRSTIHTD